MVRDQALMGKPGGKASPRKITKRLQEQQALELRLGGLTYTAIGQKMGFSVAKAHRLVTGALNRLNEKVAETAEQVRRMELERLDVMAKGLWPDAQAGDRKAVEGILKIMERRAKLLGLDALPGMETVAAVIVNIVPGERESGEGESDGGNVGNDPQAIPPDTA